MYVKRGGSYKQKFENKIIWKLNPCTFVSGISHNKNASMCMYYKHLISHRIYTNFQMLQNIFLYFICIFYSSN